MKKPDLKMILLFLMTVIYIIIKLVFNISNILNTFIWLLIYFFGIIFSLSNYNRFENDKNKITTIFIPTIIILIIYFVSGLLFGYADNALFISGFGIFSNIFNFILIIFFQEYIRALFISYINNKKKYLAIITILFILNEINFVNNSFYYNFVNIFLRYIPIILRQVLLTYITYNYGYKNSCLYRIIITIFNVFLPILPNCNWAINSIFQTLIPITNFLVLNFERKLEENKLSPKDLKKENPISYIPYFIFLIIMFLFIIGVFNYKITAVMSNSMYPLFERGDAIITKSIKDVNDLKVGDIIKFKRGNEYIIHRINNISLDDEDNIVFITKGDNNLIVDNELVYAEDIESIYLFKIKYIGYPSVWISDALKR